MVTPKKPTPTSPAAPASGGKSAVAQTPSARVPSAKPSLPALTSKPSAQATTAKPSAQTAAAKGTHAASATRSARAAGAQAQGSQTTPSQRRAPIVSSASSPETMPSRSNLRGDGPEGVSAAERTALIERAAYFRAQGRGFAPGHEVEDWVAAEQEVDQLRSATGPAKRRAS